MRKNFFTKTKGEVRWRRYSRRANASFLSLHRQVTIGVLGVAMLAAADLKAGTLHASSTPDCGIATLSAAAEESPIEGDSLSAVTLAPVEVTAVGKIQNDAEAPRLIAVIDRAAIKASAARTINDILKLAAGIDVRQRGAMGVQTDLSIHGGTMDQVTVLLNGVNITSPQTGHHSADFPVSPDEIERIEVLEGTALQAYGTAAFSGCINIVTKQDHEMNVRASAMGGSYGLGGGDVSLHLPWGKSYHHLSGGYTRSDGATDNSDFVQRRGLYRGQFMAPKIELDWQAALSSKSYGANTFYSARYPNQWEETNRWMTALQLATKGVLQVRSSLYWNRYYDHFQLIRNTATGENYHRTDVWGFSLGLVYVTSIGEWSLAGEVKEESIRSTNLGRPTADSLSISGSNRYYTKKDDRTHTSATLGYRLPLRDWTLSAALQMHRDSRTDKNFSFYPGADVVYRPTAEWKFYLSANRSFRTPTFTELYYKSPTNDGNSNLKAEKIMAVNMGAEWTTPALVCSATLFYNHCTDLIDWVKYTAQDDKFHSTGFTLDNMGVEAGATLYPSRLWKGFPLRRLQAGFSAINQHRSDKVAIYKSNYALEYLRQKWVVQAEAALYRSLYLSLSLRWQDRKGGYEKYDAATATTTLVSYSPYAVTDARLWWEFAHGEVYAECNNLFDKTYYDLGNVAQPGRWLMAGISWKFK